MKIYVVVEDWVCDSGENGVRTTCFSTIEKARDYMRNESQQYKNQEDYNYNKFEEGENSFSAYVDGNYYTEHTDFNIYENELN